MTDPDGEQAATGDLRDWPDDWPEPDRESLKAAQDALVEACECNPSQGMVGLGDPDGGETRSKTVVEQAVALAEAIEAWPATTNAEKVLSPVDVRVVSGLRSPDPVEIVVLVEQVAGSFDVGPTLEIRLTPDTGKQVVCARWGDVTHTTPILGQCEPLDRLCSQYELQWSLTVSEGSFPDVGGS